MDSSLIEKYLNIFTYFQSRNQKIVALNLLANGLGIFKRANIISNLDALKQVNLNEPITQIKSIETFFFTKIMDDTHIITCFENFMKGVLLQHGYLVHILTSKNKVCQKEQYSRPIKIAEVFNEDSFSHLSYTNESNWETSKKTISFSTLLKPKYQEIVVLPNDILKIIQKMNEDRNTLHLISSINFELSSDIIRNYEKLIEFSDNIIYSQILHLQDYLKENV